MKKRYLKTISILLLAVMSLVIIFPGNFIVHADTYICGDKPLNSGKVYDCNNQPLNAGGRDGYYTGGDLCSPVDGRICNICNKNYSGCPHSEGQIYGGTVCSPSIRICNICHSNFNGCPHSEGTTYGGIVCAPFDGTVCNICNGNYNGCPHASGQTYNGVVCSPYSGRICNVCNKNFNGCPHSAGQTYGGTVCSPSISICNICGGNYNGCPHSSGKIYGGTTCTPFNGKICNICNSNYNGCPHMSGQLYNRTWVPPTPNTYHIHSSSCSCHYTTHTHTSACLSSSIVKPIIHGTEAGYVGDTGLDIAAPKGTACVAALSGTIIYSEYGHTGWTTPPDTPYSILIKLDNPITFENRTAYYIWYTHLSELTNTVHEGDGQNIHVNAGTAIGKSGLGNNNAHLHFGVIINRNQASSSDYYSMDQVRRLLNLQVGQSY